MNGPLPTLSVVMACRNSESTLQETLEALVPQEYPLWWEVLVLDSGSTDGTVALARTFEDRLPNLRVLSVPDPGYQARAINYGMANSKGEAFVFLDSDDLVGPDYLLNVGKALVNAPFVGARLDIDRLNPPNIRKRRDPLQVDRIDTYCHYRPAVVGAAMAGRREPLELVGGWDESLPTQHDLDLSWRLAEIGVEATFVPDATVHYRYRTSVRDVFSQERGYGVGEVVLYRKFKRGMRRRSVAQVLAGYGRLFLALVRLPTSGGPARLATHLGQNLGRIEGSLKYRTFYL